MASSSSVPEWLSSLLTTGAFVAATMAPITIFTAKEYFCPHEQRAVGDKELQEDVCKRIQRLTTSCSTNRFEKAILSDVIDPYKIDVKFDSIGGLEDVKQKLYEFSILPLKRPELFAEGKLLTPQKGVLLYGPPGTGKTTLAKALARESGAVFINIKGSTLIQKWMGDSEKMVAAIFSVAHELQPSIIFLDEVDSFLGKRKDNEHDLIIRMKTEFMSLWDGLTTDKNARVMVLAATNRPAALDAAVLRRLPRAFKIDLPNRSERSNILQIILKGERTSGEIDFDCLADKSEGYSGSDLYEMCKEAAYYPIRELIVSEKNGEHSQKPRGLRHDDLEKALAESKEFNNGASEYKFAA